jgi:hypothetical protein
MRFDELAFTDDVGHATPAGREVALAARQRLEADSADLIEFKRCDPGPDVHHQQRRSRLVVGTRWNKRSHNDALCPCAPADPSPRRPHRIRSDRLRGHRHDAGAGPRTASGLST